ncbi:MAG: PD-(D/E)XK nuclease family protein [bacterium]|nr:PD-(D/E)XK nuclease family protein [bacterium]
MQYQIISAKENFIECIAHNLIADGKDYSSNLVVFPGKRPAHFLRKELARINQTSIIPPVIFSIDEFIDFIYIEKLGKYDRHLDVLDATALLFNLHTQPTETYQPLGGQYFLTADNFFPLGIKLFNDLEELYIESVPVDRIRQIEPALAIPEQTAARLQSLSYFYTQFYQSLAEKGYSTRAYRYRTVAENISKDYLNEFNRIIFAGFYAFTESEKQIVRKLKGAQTVFYYFQQGVGLDTKLEELGFKQPQFPEQPPATPQYYFYKSPDTHGQVFALQTLLHPNSDMGKQTALDEKTVIVLPTSETLFPLLHQTLSQFDESAYNIALGYPLNRTPIFGFFNCLMELINSIDDEGRVYIPRYIEFILHPYTKNIYFNGTTATEPTRILMHTVEEILLQKRNRTFWTLTEIESDSDLRTALSKKLENVPDSNMNADTLLAHLQSIHKETILKLTKFNNIAEFAQNAISILKYIYDHSTAKMHQFFYPYSEAFIAVLDTVSNSLISNLQFTEKNNYFLLFKKYIETCSVPFSGTPLRGLQVLGLLETRNIKFDTVYFLDFNEGIIPSTKREDTLLPVKVREQLHLPTYRDREQLLAYYLDTLFKGANSVHLLFIETDEKEKSRFAERLLWQKQQTEKVKTAEQYIQTIQYAVDLHTDQPKPIAKTADMIKFLEQFEFSPSSLNRYLVCPLQFYFADVLGLQEKEGITDQTEQREIGSMVHDLLNKYFKDLIGQPLTEQALSLNKLRRLVQERFREDYGSTLTGASYMLYLQVLQHLQEFLEEYQKEIIKNTSVTILELERRIAITKNGFVLKGYLDRVESRGDNYVIIDYKTAANPNNYKIKFDKLNVTDRNTWQKAIPTVQLPFYLLLYSEDKKVPLSQLQSMFLLLGKNRLTPNLIECPLFAQNEPEPMDKLYEKLEKIIFSLLKEIVDPKVPFKHTAESKETCPTCEFYHICY